jgi:hypothetical protein
VFDRVHSAVFILATVAAWLAATSAQAQVELSENFTTATQTTGGWTLTSGFWPAQNNSTNPQPYSPTGGAWGPGGGLFDPPPSGPNGAYFATDTTATGTDGGTVSDWLMSPVLTLHAGDTVSFFTRTRNPEEGPSRLEVRASTSGSSTNVGTLPNDVGAFNLLLGTVNPLLAPGVYPETWTQFTFSMPAITGAPTGRIAFHTFYTNGGFGGPNGDTVGLDNVQYTAVPEPGTLCLAAFGGLVIACRASKRHELST